MWTRVDLKNYAKDFLKKYYWSAFIVCLVFLILSGNGNSSRSNNRQDNMTGNEWIYEDSRNFMDEGRGWVFGSNRSSREGDFILRGTFNLIRDMGKGLGGIGSILIGSTLSIFIVLFIIVGLLLGPLITVGKNRFFLHAFKGDVEITKVFSTFNMEEFWPIFKSIFLTNLKNLLWFFLLIIPGIIKAYEYQMVAYLVAEDSSLTSSQAIMLSKRMTDGHKWDMFLLDLSFIGWNILGGLLFGLGHFFVAPYYEATMARLYRVLSEPYEEEELAGEFY